MVHTKVVTFPLQISVMDKLATVTNCIVKFCNTAKRNCRTSTTCPIGLPVQDRQFVVKPFNEKNNKDSKSNECESEMVSWIVSGPKRGNLIVKVSNTNEVKEVLLMYNFICLYICRHHCFLMYPYIVVN